MGPAPLPSERQQPQDHAYRNRASPSRPVPAQISDHLLLGRRIAQVRERLGGWYGDTEKLAEGLPGPYLTSNTSSLSAGMVA